MAGPTTEVLGEDLKGLRAEVRSIAVSLAGLRAEIGFAKWLFGIVAGAMLASIASGIWWSATLSADTRALDTRLGKVESQFGKVESQFDKVQIQFDKVQTQFDKVETRFEKVDARLDKLQSSIDQLAASIRDQPPRTK